MIAWLLLAAVLIGWDLATRERRRRAHDRLGTLPRRPTLEVPREVIARVRIAELCYIEDKLHEAEMIAEQLIREELQAAAKRRKIRR